MWIVNLRILWSLILSLKEMLSGEYVLYNSTRYLILMGQIKPWAWQPIHSSLSSVTVSWGKGLSPTRRHQIVIRPSADLLSIGSSGAKFYWFFYISTIMKHEWSIASTSVKVTASHKIQCEFIIPITFAGVDMLDIQCINDNLRLWYHPFTISLTYDYV